MMASIEVAGQVAADEKALGQVASAITEAVAANQRAGEQIVGLATEIYAFFPIWLQREHKFIFSRGGPKSKCFQVSE